MLFRHDGTLAPAFREPDALGMHDQRPVRPVPAPQQRQQARAVPVPRSSPPRQCLPRRPRKVGRTSMCAARFATIPGELPKFPSGPTHEEERHSMATVILGPPSFRASRRVRRLKPCHAPSDSSLAARGEQLRVGSSPPLWVGCACWSTPAAEPLSVMNISRGVVRDAKLVQFSRPSAPCCRRCSRSCR